MKLIKRFVLSVAVFIFLISSVEINCFANNIEGYESEFNKIQIRDSSYTIVFSDTEYYVMDENNKLIENNEANYIHSIYENDGEVYLINIIHECDEYRWQLVKLNIGKEMGIEIIVDKAHSIFHTKTNGIVVVNKLENNIYEFNYCNGKGNEEKIILSMDGFNDYGSLRNVKEIDIIESKILFLTIAGEVIEYDVSKEEFTKINNDFVYSLSTKNN